MNFPPEASITRELKQKQKRERASGMVVIYWVQAALFFEMKAIVKEISVRKFRKIPKLFQFRNATDSTKTSGNSERKIK